jgi:P-type Ca2+ transporter type 2C
MSQFYKLTVEEILKELKTDVKTGLKQINVDLRQKKYGLNEITHEKKLSPLKIFFQQFINPLVYILIAAIIISLAIQHFLDAYVILAIVILNAILGFTQEYKAEKALEMLKKMAAPHARVLRNGHIKQIEANKLVPGDILILETGDKVPADARIIESVNLKVNEAILTGESVPKDKTIDKIEQDAVLADQINMLFAGTAISYGRGKAIITGTGNKTEFGKIAESLHTIEEHITPLQRKLGKFGKKLGLIAIGVIIIVFFLSLLKEIPPEVALMTSISLAVAAIPEGLPAVVTIALAIGVKRLVKNKALIRKLAAVETLGSTTVICSDKTGTMTSGEMTTRAIYANNSLIKVSGSGYSLDGTFSSKGQPYNPEKIHKLLETSYLCNNSDPKEKQGDPTELALKVVALKGKIKTDFHRIDEIPFDSSKKYMATLDQKGNTKNAHIKGAPEIVLEMCKHMHTGTRIRPLTDRDKEKIMEMNDQMATSALRVLAFAYSEDGSMKNLVFLGLMGMIDPPRESVPSAVKAAKKAGIRVVMITGDNALTAKAIASQIGIKSEVITGVQLDRMSDDAILNTVKQVSIFARVNPEHKVKILEALQKEKHIVAMTGDGINDAPALKRADVGIAMSISGTDVSKESSDMILLDDHFSNIVKAIKYGRSIYDNIKKFVKFLLSANLGEISVIFFSLLFSFPLPLLPLQILWVNLVTDGLPALALGMDPAEKGIMKRKPRPTKETILSGTKGFIITTTIIATIIVLGLFMLEYFTTSNLDKARTIALTTLIFFELFLAFSCRSKEKNIFQLGFFTNKYLIGAVSLSIILHLLLIYTPLASLFSLTGLALMDWARILGASIIGVAILEIRKIWLK